MQSLPNDVFQELQQQRAGQEQTTTRQDRSSDRGRGTGDPAGRQESETSLSLTPEDGPHASTSSPSTSFFGSAFGASLRPSGPETPGRGHGTQGEAQSASEAGVAARVRSRAGSRASGATSWPPTAETVPSQLVGGRVGTDADVLNAHSSDNSKTEDATSDCGPSLLSPTLALCHETDTYQASAAQTDQYPQQTPITPTSQGSSPSTPSSSSKKSHTSSFAHLLRNRRDDKRLLKKQSKPSEHLHGRSSILRQPAVIKQSPSYYKPKIVEDTTLSTQPLSSADRSYVSSSLPPTPSTPTSVIANPARRTRPSLAQSPSEHRPSISAASSSVTKKRGGTLRSSSSLDIPLIAPVTRRRHVKGSSGSQSRSIDSSQDPDPATLNHHHHAYSHVVGPGVLAKRSYHDQTPPEAEPRMPMERDSSRGDHYFRTSETNVVHEKQPPHTLGQIRPVDPKVETVRDVQTSRPPAVKFHSDTVMPVQRSHKSSSIFNALSIAPKTDITLDALSGSTPATWLPTPTSPDITVSSPPAMSTKRRFSSYFSPAPQSQRSSDSTPPSGLSPVATNWEDVAAESKAAGPPSNVTTPASPFTQARRRPNVLRRHGTFNQTQPPPVIHKLSSESILSVVSSGPITGLQPKYTSSSGKEYNRTSLTGPGALNFLPSEMKRVDTSSSKIVDAAGKKLAGFKAIIPKSSIQSLLPRFSLPRLKRKPSQRYEPEIPRDPLEVTAFQQTPFSQRYGDARRLKMNQIRSYVEETLEDDEDGSSMSPFELDVPDHLPSSPLCPLSPKHKSGGKAICPIHRKEKTYLGPSGGGGKTGEAGKVGGGNMKRGPTVVYESSQQEEGERTGSGGFGRDGAGR